MAKPSSKTIADHVQQYVIAIAADRLNQKGFITRHMPLPVKTKKRIVSFLFVFIMVATLAGCKMYEGTYIFFRQDHGNVQKIEICDYDHKNNRTRTTVATLTQEQQESLLADLAMLPCKQYFPGDHIRSYGRFQICITYTDGELELIGPYNIGYVTAEGIACLTNYYPASEQVLWDLIAKYVDSDTIKSLK